MVPGYDTQCIGIEIFSCRTLHVSPGDEFFATQRTVIWTFPSNNLCVALFLFCGFMIFAIYINNLNLLSMCDYLCSTMLVWLLVQYYVVWLLVQ